MPDSAECPVGVSENRHTLATSDELPTPDFQPAFWLRNPHLQSVLSAMPWRRHSGKRALRAMSAITQEHLIDAGDGVRLLGSHTRLPNRSSRGLVLLLHGWEGSIESGYLQHAAAKLLVVGFDVFRLNFRDHGGTQHLNEGMFHSCRLLEVVNAARWITEKFPAPAFFAAGYSLGGNFALRLALAAPEAGLALHHATAICPAVDPSAVMERLENGPRWYHDYFMHKWRDSLRKKRALFPEQHDFDDAILDQDMRGLTRWLVQRHANMASIEDYFAGYAVAGDRLQSLKVPVSILAAADDPIIPIASLHALQLPAHSCLHVAAYGGHCGFIESARMTGFSERWLVQQIERAQRAQLALFRE